VRELKKLPLSVNLEAVVILVCKLSIKFFPVLAKQIPKHEFFKSVETYLQSYLTFSSNFLCMTVCFPQRTLNKQYHVSKKIDRIYSNTGHLIRAVFRLPIKQLFTHHQVFNQSDADFKLGGMR